MRPIDADVLKEQMLAETPEHERSIVDLILEALVAMIDEQPTIEPKKGKWIAIWDKNNPHISSRGRCSICGRETDRPLGDYCKWCGADMRGDDHEID